MLTIEVLRRIVVSLRLLTTLTLKRSPLLKVIRGPMERAVSFRCSLLEVSRDCSRDNVINMSRRCGNSQSTYFRITPAGAIFSLVSLSWKDCTWSARRGGRGGRGAYSARLLVLKRVCQSLPLYTSKRQRSGSSGHSKSERYQVHAHHYKASSNHGS